MADVLNSEKTESKPLTTQLETPTLEAATEHAEPSHETTHNPAPIGGAGPAEDANSVATLQASVASDADSDSPDDLEMSGMEDFAAALESFDREQAAEA